MDPETNSVVPPSCELSVFWRIENFSLLGFFTPVRSAPFSLRCGSRRRFYLEFHPARAILLPGTVRLRVAADEHSNRTTGDERPPRVLRVSFHAVLATGEHQEIHRKGRILDGLKLKDCKGWFERFPYLVTHREKHLPDDTLTFLVQFSSEEPVFEVGRLHALTRIPVKSFSFQWQVDLSVRSSTRSVPSMPIDLEWRRACNRRSFTLIVMPRGLAIPPVVCDVSSTDECGERAVIGELGVVAIKGQWYTLSKSFCRSHLREGLLGRGNVTLCFKLRTADGEPVAEDFGEAPLALGCGDRNETPVRSSFWIPHRKSTATKQLDALCARNDASEDSLLSFLIGGSDANETPDPFSSVPRLDRDSSDPE